MKFTKVIKAEENFNLDSELNSFIESIKNNEDTLDSWLNNYRDTKLEDLQTYARMFPLWLKEDLNKYSKLIAKRLCQYKAIKQIIENSGK